MSHQPPRLQVGDGPRLSTRLTGNGACATGSSRPVALRRLVPSAYRPVLANRVFRRLIVGFAVSYLGDG